MTRKHFEAIAANMREHMAAARINGGDAEYMRVWLMCLDLAGMFGQWNPNFDRVRFLDACRPPVVG